ncbi:MAG: hypothetical protein LUP94_00530 [Candidatus Methanomethylicus sp.]|nr:hypothetical protein [Candidatus Methanomethylicus sp.]
MAKQRSILKWALAVGLVLIAPWMLFVFAAAYIWKTGILAKAYRHLVKELHKAEFNDRIFRWRVARCKGLAEKRLNSTYYAVSDDAPFVVLKAGIGFKCITTFKFKDTSGSPEDSRRALGEAIKVLQNSQCQAVITLAISGEKDLNRIQVITRGSPFNNSMCNSKGIASMDLMKIIAKMMEGEAPTMRVKICYGREILESIDLEGC